jgi:tetratricopeptide (TPR) repeat protein
VIPWSQRAIELDSTLAIAQKVLGIDYVFAGQAEKGARVLDRNYAREPAQPWARGYVILSYAASGRWPEVGKLYHDLTHDAQARFDDLLLAHLAVGDRAKALDAFERMTRSGLGQVPIGCDPLFDPVHNEPRYLAVIHRFGAGLCPVTTPWPIKGPPATFALKQ